MSQTNNIPQHIITAADALLGPFGVNIRQILAAPSSETQLTKKYLTVAEVEKYYSVGRWMIWRAARAGKLHTVKPNGNGRHGRVLIDKASLETWLEGKESAEKCH